MAARTTTPPTLKIGCAFTGLATSKQAVRFTWQGILRQYAAPNGQIVSVDLRFFNLSSAAKSVTALISCAGNDARDTVKPSRQSAVRNGHQRGVREIGVARSAGMTEDKERHGPGRHAEAWLNAS